MPKFWNRSRHSSKAPSTPLTVSISVSVSSQGDMSEQQEQQGRGVVSIVCPLLLPLYLMRSLWPLTTSNKTLTLISFDSLLPLWVTARLSESPSQHTQILHLQTYDSSEIALQYLSPYPLLLTSMRIPSCSRSNSNSNKRGWPQSPSQSHITTSRHMERPLSESKIPTQPHQSSIRCSHQRNLELASYVDMLLSSPSHSSPSPLFW